MMKQNYYANANVGDQYIMMAQHNPNVPMRRRTDPAIMMPYAQSMTPHSYLIDDRMSKMGPPILPLGMPFGNNMKQTKKVLTQQELEGLFIAASSHQSVTRSKRDVAILALILDLHLSSGTIIRMKFSNVRTIMESIRNGQEANYQGHYVEIDQGSTTAGRLLCHPFTAWALFNWINELMAKYSWKPEDDMPLFVNSQPLYDSETGAKSLRQISLKRDAISKVFQSIKHRSGIACHKSVVASSSLQLLTPVYVDLINRFMSEWFE
jgi:hypothetical protein